MKQQQPCLEKQQTYLAYNLFDEPNTQRINEIRTKEKDICIHTQTYTTNEHNKQT